MRRIELFRRARLAAGAEISIGRRDAARSSGRLLFLALAAGCLAIAGCGRHGYDSGTVSGEVRIGGTPVPKGYITFTPTGKGQGPVTGAEIVNGKYRCEKVPLGKENVTFAAQAAQPTTVYDHVAKTTHEVPKNILPAKYRAGIPMEVAAGDNHHDFLMDAK